MAAPSPEDAGADGPPATTDPERRRRRLPSGSVQARSTVRGVLALQGLANGLGLLVVVAYIRFLFPAAVEPGDEGDLLLLGGYLGLNVVVALPLNALLLRRAVRWVRLGSDPTRSQRRLLYRLPLLETLSALVAWLGGAALFALLNDGASRAAIGIVLAGTVTCTFLYLLLDGHFRPVLALALAHDDLPEGRRDVLPRLLLAWLLGSGVPLVAVSLAPVLGSGRFDPDRLPWIAAFGLLGGGAVMVAAAVSVSRPLNRVRLALRQVEQGDLDVFVPVDDLGELGRLAEGVNDLVAGLREREELRDLFGRQVGAPQLAELAAAGGFHDGGERREVTVLFVDLQGYTSYSERHSPEEVVAMLNRFFRVVVAVVDREGGWVNKFEGDAALCVFGAPQDEPDHAARALRAAAALRRELRATPALLPAGIGLATGEAVAGFIGTAERFEYTVIGDCVNLAARLCDLAKDHRSGVLAAEATIGAGRPDPDEWTEAGRVRVRGRAQRSPVFTLAAPRRRRIGALPFSPPAPSR